MGSHHLTRCEDCQRLGQSIQDTVSARRARNSPTSQEGHWSFYRKSAIQADTSCELCQLVYWVVTQGEPALSVEVRMSGMDNFSIGIQRDCGYSSPEAWLVTQPSETRISLRTEAVRNGFSGRMIDPLHVNYDYFRQRLRESTIGNGIASDSSRPLPALKVIDCMTKRVVFAPDDCAYVALSYVWGRQSDPAPSTAVQTPLDKACLRDDVPLTVKDAMVATRGLGFQYLWVDQYCIDQSNHEEKMCFVGQMDKIYNSAVLTIVAAAGDSAYSGLPGVSSVPRTQQKSINLGGLRYLVLPDPVVELKNSIWSSRGWTYQEGRLSKRLLFFTQSQVYFLCTETHFFYREGLIEPETIGPWGAAEMPVHIGRWTDPENVLVDANHYVSCQVSRDTDRLNAFLGILHAYQAAQVFHVWGMPLSVANECNDVDQGFARSLYWWPGQAEEVRRQELFPSWSWLGWKNLTTIKWPVPFTAIANASAQPPVAVQVSQISPTSHEEKNMSLCDHVALLSMGADPRLVSPVISITGHASKCRILGPNQVDLDLPITLESASISTCLPGIPAADCGEIRDKSVDALYIALRSVPSPGIGEALDDELHMCFILVSKLPRSTRYTRVGTLQVNLVPAYYSALSADRVRDHQASVVEYIRKTWTTTEFQLE